jgi:hypothetical protein
MTRRLAAGLAALALALGGCSLPDSTEPKYVGPAAEPRRAQDRAEEAPKAAGTTSLTALVADFLKTSVAGNVTNDQSEALSETQLRMKTFMTEAAAAQWQPQGQQPQLLVVKVALAPDTLPDGRSVINAHFTRVGLLDSEGQLKPPPNDPAWVPDFVFEGEEVNGQLLLSKVPPGMLLSVEGLSSLYTRQPIYFWEQGVDAPKLVPDLRYMPNVLPESRRVSEAVNWIVTGPAEWLTTVVAKLTPDIEMKNTTLNPDTSVNVNLTSKAAGKNPEDLRRLASQIRWSLAGHPPVTLSFENAKDAFNDSNGYQNDNAAVVQSELDQDKFVVVNESVRPVAGPPSSTPVLFGASEWNKAVVSATINRARTRAGLVRKVGTKLQLFVNSDTREPKYVDSLVPPSGTLSRPAWINRPVQAFLVADGARLWAVTPPGGAGEATQQPVVVPGPNGQELTNVSAFSVSPDGRRIALIVGRKTMIAPLRVESGKLTLGEQHEVPNSLGDNQAVGWISETTLAIGGKPSPGAAYSMVWTSIDGTGEKVLPLSGPVKTETFTVTELSARTNDPARSLEQVLVVFQDERQQARGVYANSVDDIQVDQPGGTPSPTSSPQPLVARSPFYAD